MAMTVEEVFKYGSSLGRKAAMNVLISAKDKKWCKCEDECDKCMKVAAERLYYLYYITDDTVQTFVAMIGTASVWKRPRLWRRYKKGVKFGIEVGIARRKRRANATKR